MTATQEVGWLELCHTGWRLLRLSLRISLRRKLPFMIVGVAIYYAIVYALAVYEPFEGFGVREALLALVDLPGAVLGIYLTMDLVAKERDRQTLETLFSTASSHYFIWSVRLLCVFAVLLAALLTMSTAAYVLFAEFPFVAGALNTFVPSFFMGALTFWFATRTRGANTAAMLGSGALILVLMFGELLVDTSYWLFMNPFEVPFGGDEFYWAERFFLNRAAILLCGFLLLFLAFRRMERREKFLS